jgi:hypothetical protein
MRRSHQTWTTVLTRLSFRRTLRHKKRSAMRRRNVRLEMLEDRRMLDADAWRAALDVAPPSFEIGDFTLTSTDWSGKAEGGRVMANGYALGIESKGADKDAGGFQPGEFWSFTFNEPGRLMGIHFEGFNAEDADKALLYVGDAEPIVVDAERVKGGYWRPDRLLEFADGDTLRLVGAEPSAEDLTKARDAYGLRVSKLDERAAEAEPKWNATGEWKVQGFNVIGLTDETYGGFIDLAQKEHADSVGVSAALSERVRPAARPDFGAFGDDSTSMGTSAMVPDVIWHDFEVKSLTETNQFKFTYEVTNGPLGVSNFNVRLYRSTDGATPNGAALATYNITNVSTGMRSFFANVDLGNDVQEDYYLLAVIEDAGDDTLNNKKEFEGGAFRDDTTGIAYYHAAKSDTTSDLMRVENSTTITRWNGSTYAPIYTHPTNFTSVHIRTHGGNDLINMFSTVDATLWAFSGTGSDTIYSSKGDDFLSGGTGVNSIYGGDGEDLIYGGDDDTWQGAGYGTDMLFGQNGNDWLYGKGGPDWIDGGADSDHMEGGNEAENNGTFYDGYGDYLVGGTGNDAIYGGNGGDYLYGNAGDDLLDGGKDNDLLDAGDGDDFLVAGGGNDTSHGRLGVDTVFGGAGNDTLYGNEGAMCFTARTARTPCMAGLVMIGLMAVPRTTYSTARMVTTSSMAVSAPIRSARGTVRTRSRRAIR